MASVESTRICANSKVIRAQRQSLQCDYRMRALFSGCSFSMHTQLLVDAWFRDYLSSKTLERSGWLSLLTTWCRGTSAWISWSSCARRGRQKTCRTLWGSCDPATWSNADVRVLSQYKPIRFRYRYWYFWVLLRSERFRATENTQTIGNERLRWRNEQATAHLRTPAILCLGGCSSAIVS